MPCVAPRHRSTPAHRRRCRRRRLQAQRNAAQEPAPRLPVRAAAANEDDAEWVADAQQQWAAPALPAVQGITVVDELAAELEQREREQREQQEQQELEQQRQARAKQDRPAAKQRAGATDY